MAAQIDDSKDVLDNNKTVPWYREKPDQFNPAARELLERYSHVAPDEVDSHAQDVVGPARDFLLFLADLKVASEREPGPSCPTLASARSGS